MYCYGINIGNFAFLIGFLIVTLVCVSADDLAKRYAIYFPQFHEDPLNNMLWRKNFTDWDNLRAAPEKNRKGYPLLRPTEFGYYDLLDIDIRRKQAKLAKEYGINGFIYHHYWFYHMFLGASLNGVIEKILVDNEPNLPFALNWAQESWTNSWNGKYKYDSDKPVVLVPQLIPHPDHPMVKEHYDFLKRFFHHKNYILVNGCPLFFVYAKSSTPEVIAIREKLRQYAMEDGFPSPGLHIPAMYAMKNHVMYKQNIPTQNFRTTPRAKGVSGDMSTTIHDAAAFYPYIAEPKTQMVVPTECLLGSWKDYLTKPSYLGVVTSYDNTPRRDAATALISGRHFYPEKLGGAPMSLQHDVVETLLYDKCCVDPDIRDKGGKFILINAWNEWGEGMVLEPNNVYGRKLIEAIKNGVSVAEKLGCDYQNVLEYRKKYDY